MTTGQAADKYGAPPSIHMGETVVAAWRPSFVYPAQSPPACEPMLDSTVWLHICCGLYSTAVGKHTPPEVGLGGIPRESALAARARLCRAGAQEYQYSTADGRDDESGTLQRYVWRV
jgi:hypothetical protein